MPQTFLPATSLLLTLLRGLPIGRSDAVAAPYAEGSRRCTIDLKWTDAEKKQARQIFDGVLQDKLDETLREVKRSAAAAAADASQMWALGPYLETRRREIDNKYDCRCSQVIMVFAILLREGRISVRVIAATRRRKAVLHPPHRQSLTLGFDQPVARRAAVGLAALAEIAMCSHDARAQLRKQLRGTAPTEACATPERRQMFRLQSLAAAATSKRPVRRHSRQAHQPRAAQRQTRRGRSSASKTRPPMGHSGCCRSQRSPWRAWSTRASGASSTSLSRASC